MTNQPENMKVVFSTEEAATYMGMSKSALNKSRLTGELFNTTPPEHKRYGRSVKYTKADLDNWLAALPAYKTLAEQEAG